MDSVLPPWTSILLSMALVLVLVEVKAVLPTAVYFLNQNKTWLLGY